MVAYLGIHKQHTCTLCGLNDYVIEYEISCRLLCLCVRSDFFTKREAIECFKILRDKYGWQRACHLVMVMCLTQTHGSASALCGPHLRTSCPRIPVNMQLPTLCTMG
jgi:hypothetical protein